MFMIANDSGHMCLHMDLPSIVALKFRTPQVAKLQMGTETEPNKQTAEVLPPNYTLPGPVSMICCSSIGPHLLIYSRHDCKQAQRGVLLTTCD